MRKLISIVSLVYIIMSLLTIIPASLGMELGIRKIENITEEDVKRTFADVTPSCDDFEGVKVEETTSVETEAAINETETYTEPDTEAETGFFEEEAEAESETYIEAEAEWTYETPYGLGAFKSYTNYELLNRASQQWTLIQCNENAYSDENGLRKVGEYYCVAMGSYYTRTLGDLFKITTANGTFNVIICDFKADVDTNETHQYTLANGCMTEFYVDMSCFNSTARMMGDVSYARPEFMGAIIDIAYLGNYFN